LKKRPLFYSEPTIFQGFEKIRNKRTKNLKNAERAFLFLESICVLLPNTVITRRQWNWKMTLDFKSRLPISEFLVFPA